MARVIMLFLGRKQIEAKKADDDDMKALEDLETMIKSKH